MGRRLLWAAWVCALVAAPTGLLVVELVYPDVPSHPPPWPSEPSQPERFAGGLLIAHLVLSPIAAVAVPLLVRWRPHEFTVGIVFAAWLGIAILLVMMRLATLFVVMGKTGKYL